MIAQPDFFIVAEQCKSDGGWKTGDKCHSYFQSLGACVHVRWQGVLEAIVFVQKRLFRIDEFPDGSDSDAHCQLRGYILRTHVRLT